MAKKIRDLTKLTEEQQTLNSNLLKHAKGLGVANKNLDEPVPTPEEADCEQWIAGKNNTFMVLGRDRPNNRYSGFGGRGATQAGRIDLIAGLGSSYRHKDGTFGPPNEKTVISPNFAIDGARVYISQKANIDRYMGLAPSNHPGESGRGSSAVGIKADAIRIHARQDIKIVTGRGRFNGLGADGERLADGSVNEVPGTISFIAGNYLEDTTAGSLNMLRRRVKKGVTQRKLQPLVKGDNLENCLRDIFSLISELGAQISANGFAVEQMNLSTTGHIHNVPLPAPIPVIPSITYAPIGTIVGTQCITRKAAEQSLMKRIDGIMINYLGNQGTKGSQEMTKKHILSKYVFTT